MVQWDSLFLLLFRFFAVSVAAFHYSKFVARAERIGSNGIGRLLVVRIEYRSRRDENEIFLTISEKFELHSNRISSLEWSGAARIETPGNL